MTRVCQHTEAPANISLIVYFLNITNYHIYILCIHSMYAASMRCANKQFLAQFRINDAKLKSIA